MPSYLVQAAYTSGAWATMVKHPQDRLDLIRPVAERLGGKLVQGWFSFGEYDVIVVLEMPDHVSAAAFTMAAQAGGALKATRTTPLLTIAETLEAERRAATSGYVPPYDIVDEASEESFPASDPPAWGSNTQGRTVPNTDVNLAG